MEYKELKKFYYSDEQKYKEEYKNRFSSDDTVKLDFYIADNQAFFMQTAQVYSLAYKISKIDKDILKITKRLPRIAIEQYTKKCLIDEAVVTNKIEGVHSSRKEIGEVLSALDGQSKGKNKLRFKGLVKKYLTLLSKKEIKLENCEDVRNIYDELVLTEVQKEEPDNVPDGKYFRKESTSVYSSTGKELHRGLYPESNIIDSVQKALSFLNNESADELFKVCIFHYLIEYIHPFYDGNGRLGRFILSYCISKNLEPIIAYRISAVIKRNIKQYYDAFEKCNNPLNRGDLTPFLIMMLNNIYEAIYELHESLEHRAIRLKRYADYIEKLSVGKADRVKSLYFVLVQAALFSENGISGAQLRDMFKMTQNTLKKYLDMLDQDLLVVKTHSNSKYYEADIAKLDKMMFDE